MDDLAVFVVNASYEYLSKDAIAALKIRVFDSLGCAIGTLKGVPVRFIREHIDKFGGSDICTMIGGGRTAPLVSNLPLISIISFFCFSSSPRLMRCVHM